MFGPMFWRRVQEAKEGRSSHWNTIRNRFIEMHPTCAVCNGGKHLNVHHIKPFHLHPELELDLDNLVTLCEKSEVLGINCHFIFGHACDWRAYVPRVLDNALILNPQFTNRCYA